MTAPRQPEARPPDDDLDPSQSSTVTTVLATLAVVAIVAVAIGTLLAAAGDDGEGEGDVAGTAGGPPDPPPTETTPETTSEPPPISDTTTTSTTATTEAPIPTVPGPAIAVGPLADTRPDPPEVFAAATAGGGLILGETSSGETLTELADAPGADATDPATIGGIALSHDRRRLWYSICCEPPPGTLHELPIEPVGDAALVANSTRPVIGTSPNWVTSVGLLARLDSTRDSRSHIWEPATATSLGRATLSPDGELLAVTTASSDPDATGRRLSLVTTATVEETGTGVSEIVDPAPVVVPDSHWTLPVFRRDGSLVAARQPEADGPWSAWSIDPETLSIAPVEQIDYPGIPIDQDVDATGEWLLVVAAESAGATTGSLHWFGPDGESGTIPGAFSHAAW
ncbi:MAG: hypothetical protein U5K29_15515 [Acidimicrobiales bacterium]|nr:hypothetical protein [Acidimicrobiales bacterium]